MSMKRRDNKNRILRTGESQRKDGRYAYKYYDNRGKAHFAYSWKLEPTDRVPQGKRECLSLREKEKSIQRDMEDGIDPSGGNITVLGQVERYLSTKNNVNKKTISNYKSVLALLRKDPMGSTNIKDVKTSDAKIWFVELQRGGRKYGTIENIRNVIKPAFELAVQDKVIRKNPFDFAFKGVLENDKRERLPLTKEQRDRFLAFIKSHPIYKKYYDAIFILFHTGLRISELCGLIVTDLDFEAHTLTVNRQLQRDDHWTLYLAPPKGSKKSKPKVRTLPMSNEVMDCFRRVLRARANVKIEPMVDGVMGFVFLTQRETPTDKGVWESRFKQIHAAYCKKTGDTIPMVTPHVCRHTFCSEMAKAGMHPRNLQTIMGHSDVVVTMRVYTHLSAQDSLVDYWRTANRLQQFNKKK